eukprot:COSAG06_NODE_18095_length_904_cov_1.213665_2_plen_140_part_00
MMTIGQLKSNDSNPDSAFSSWFFNHTELLCPRGCCVCMCVCVQVFIRKLGINKAFISTIANVSPSVVTLVALLFYTAVAGAGNAPFAPFYTQKQSFDQDRLGTNIGKALKNGPIRCVFRMQGTSWMPPPSSPASRCLRT